MPTRVKYRMWCKTCNDFTLHKIKDSPITENSEEKKPKVCLECGTEYTPVYLKDLPEEKLKEQRERYKAQRTEKYIKVFQDMMLAPEQRQMQDSIHMFSSPGTEEEEIYESDAGQKIIDEERRKLREAQLEEERKIREEIKADILKYSHLRRNDICICGSGKKYKKCCLSRIEFYKKILFVKNRIL